MIIGADVSHAAPGLEQESFAAMTMSLDKTCSRYGAAVESNGMRVEMISSENVKSMLSPLVDWWIKNVGGGRVPKHVYYFRDGISEGQYRNVLKEEVADLKELFDHFGQGHPGNAVCFIWTAMFNSLLTHFNRSKLPSSSSRSGITSDFSLLKDLMGTKMATRFPELL